MTQYCPHCSGPNADFANYCTHCGKPLLAPEEKKNQTLLVVLICLVIGLVIVFVGLLAIVLIKDHSSSEKTLLQDSISAEKTLLQDSICLDSTAVEPDEAAEEIPTIVVTAEDITSTTASVDLDKLVRKASRSMEGTGDDIVFGSLCLSGNYVVCTYCGFGYYRGSKENLLDWVMEDLSYSKDCREMARCAYHTGYKFKIVFGTLDGELVYTYDNSSWLQMPNTF